ncbi:hypothetical protein [Heyndrickxia ginsengihumi]|uniref:hypothetical protein n=1 Tax=Heyndrickxia ginsengihumi TaxID=363870 RepID=UPI000471541E|nr:hypothetical protein [Heyndrickxia ginsengihumi]
MKEERIKEDILLHYVEDDRRGGREVFYSKTQGEDYHIYILAIATLIESRFPRRACVYGDISREQAQKAVDWANSILDKPIVLPVRVDPPKLLERLKIIDDEEKRLEALYDLSIGVNDGIGIIVKKHFQLDSIKSYFAKELQEYESAEQIGAERIIIQYLNAGLPLEILVDICCFDSNGPQFEQSDFVKAICSSWVFIEPEIRGYIDPVKKVTDTPETVESQFGNMFLDMGFMGRRTRRYLPKEVVIKVFKRKMKDIDELEEIVGTKYKDTVRMLEEKGTKLKEIDDVSRKNSEKNVIYSLNQLMFWNDTFELNDNIKNAITTIKVAVEESITTRTNLMQMIGDAEEKGQLIKLLSKLIQDHHNIVLTREAWDWIHNEPNDVIKRMVVMLLLFDSNRELQKLYRALLENKDLFHKYMK